MSGTFFFLFLFDFKIKLCTSGTLIFFVRSISFPSLTGFHEWTNTGNNKRFLRQMTQTLRSGASSWKWLSGYEETIAWTCWKVCVEVEGIYKNDQMTLLNDCNLSKIEQNIITAWHLPMGERAIILLDCCQSHKLHCNSEGLCKHHLCI